MARASMRQIFLFRNTLFAHPSTRPSSSSFSISASSASSSIPEERTSSPFESFEVLLHSSCLSIRQLLQIQAHLITSSLFRNSFLAKTVLRRASDLCDIGYTVLIFRHMNSLDNFCLNTVLQAYCNSHVPDQAVIFYFQSLSSGFWPNSYTFVPLIGSCAKMGCIESGRKCHGQALKNGVDSVLPVENSLIHMYGCCGHIELASEVFDNMVSRNVVSWNSIIDGYLKVGDLNAAHALFDEMPDRNVISWNVMISGCVKARHPVHALKLFRVMVMLGFKANATTMLCLIAACARSARDKEGRSVHGCIIRRMFTKSRLVIDTALIDMYCKCRRVEVARRVFERMTNRNLVSWNSMILGHCIRGSPENGLNLFHVMVGTEMMKYEAEADESPSADICLVGLLPDDITFIGVLCACARAEMLTEGRSYFKQMTDVFNVKPNFAHFWCMANLLANVGFVEEAVDFIRNMQNFDGDMSSESLLWASLLGLCRFKEDVYLGEQIAKLLVDMNPKNLACYQFLLSIYAAAGQWENVSRVQKLIKERRLGIVPGSSLEELSYIVHNFRVSNKRQEGIEAVNQMMDELAHRLRLPTSRADQQSLVGQKENTSYGE